MEAQAFKFPASPGIPLFALSPERVNVPRGIPQSPSLPNFSKPLPHSPIHSRTSSEVQGMVARFNSLDIKDYAELKKKDEAALIRAQMGREEAEAECQRMREELRAVTAEREMEKDSVRRVSKKLDIAMDDLHRAKETNIHAQKLLEKEIKIMRKEAFRSSSALVKLQEELKAARTGLKAVQSDLDLERIKLGRRDQEVFTAQYQLVGVQEELAGAQFRMKTVEGERDALKTSLKEEEVARIAAEGRIALPASKEDDYEFGSPRKQRIPRPSPGKVKDSFVEELKAEIEHQRRRCQLAEDKVEYMKMECQFQCCSCRVAEKQGLTYTHDASFAAAVPHIKGIAINVLSPPASVVSEEELNRETQPLVDIGSPFRPITPDPVAVAVAETIFPEEFAYSPNSGTFRSVPSPTKPDPRTPPTDATPVEYVSTPPHQSAQNSPARVLLDNAEPDASSSPTNPQLLPSTPHPILLPRPQVPTDFRTITTTTTIPLADCTEALPFSPGTMTREEAMELIRQRRGRARSVAGTPVKTARSRSRPTTPRRDISAPEMRGGRRTPRTEGRGRLGIR